MVMYFSTLIWSFLFLTPNEVNGFSNMKGPDLIGNFKQESLEQELFKKRQNVSDMKVLKNFADADKIGKYMTRDKRKDNDKNAGSKGKGRRVRSEYYNMEGSSTMWPHESDSMVTDPSDLIVLILTAIKKPKMTKPSVSGETTENQLLYWLPPYLQEESPKNFWKQIQAQRSEESNSSSSVNDSSETPLWTKNYKEKFDSIEGKITEVSFKNDTVVARIQYKQTTEIPGSSTYSKSVSAKPEIEKFVFKPFTTKATKFPNFFWFPQFRHSETKTKSPLQKSKVSTQWPLTQNPLDITDSSEITEASTEDELFNLIFPSSEATTQGIMSTKHPTFERNNPLLLIDIDSKPIEPPLSLFKTTIRPYLQAAHRDSKIHHKTTTEVISTLPYKTYVIIVHPNSTISKHCYENPLFPPIGDFVEPVKETNPTTKRGQTKKGNNLEPKAINHSFQWNLSDMTFQPGFRVISKISNISLTHNDTLNSKLHNLTSRPCAFPSKSDPDPLDAALVSACTTSRPIKFNVISNISKWTPKYPLYALEKWAMPLYTSSRSLFSIPDDSSRQLRSTISSNRHLFGDTEVFTIQPQHPVDPNKPESIVLQISAVQPKPLGQSNRQPYPFLEGLAQPTALLSPEEISPTNLTHFYNNTSGFPDMNSLIKKYPEMMYRRMNNTNFNLTLFHNVVLLKKNYFEENIEDLSTTLRSPQNE